MFAAKFRIIRTEQIMGTPIYVNFDYSNQGPHALSFSVGNGRADSYRFDTTPPAKVNNPYYEFGGLVAITSLGSYEKGVDAILLNKYLQFVVPGHYVVNCELDLDVTDTTDAMTKSHMVRNRLEIDIKSDPVRQREIFTALESRMMNEDVEKQTKASYALSELRENNAIPIMTRGLKSRNDVVVEHMIVGLGRIHDKEAADALAVFMKSTTSLRLKDLARQQLENFSRISSPPYR